MRNATTAAVTLATACACWVAPARADQPAPPPVKPVATRPTPQLLLELAGKPDQVPASLDPATGLVFIDHFPGPGEGTPRPRGDQHLCGAALTKFLDKTWKTEIADAIKNGKANDRLSCDGDACRAGGAGEWDPVYHFHFAPGKLTLVAVTIDDEVLVGEPTIEKEHAKQAKLIAKHKVACPKPAPPRARPAAKP